MAILRCDPINGSDSARADLVPSAYANNGSGLVRVTVSSNVLVTGAAVLIAGTTSNVYNGRWTITVIDSTHFDLQGSTYSVNPAAKGTCIPVGGDTWANALKYGTVSPTTKVLPGDVHRFVKSPDPVSIGNATWYSSDNTAQIVITSSTNTSPIVITRAGHGYATNDWVSIWLHNTNTNANGKWKITVIDANTFSLNGSVGNGVGSGGNVRRITGRVVELASARTQLIIAANATWTGVGDTTFSLGTVSKDGAYAPKATLDSAVQTSTLQMYAATGTLDLSAYQEITLYVQISAALASSGLFQIKLCSDTAGATPVDVFDIPAIPGPIGANGWVPLVITKTGGGNLGSSIKSIALYTGASAPPNSITIILSNINASKTNDLNLLSLISKNSAASGGAEPWWALCAIDGTALFLSGSVNYDFEPIQSGQSSFWSKSAYTGSGETVTTYIRSGFRFQMVTGQTTFIGGTASGTMAAYVEYQGGWNSATDLQDGDTWIDGGNCLGTGMFLSFIHYHLVNRINFVRFGGGYVPYNARQPRVTLMAATDCPSGVNLTTCYGFVGAFGPLVQCSGAGLYLGSMHFNTLVTSIVESSCNQYGISVLGPCTALVIRNMARCRYNANNAIIVQNAPGDILVADSELGVAVNQSGARPFYIGNAAGLVLRNCVYVGAYTTGAQVAALSDLIPTSQAAMYVFHEKENGVAGVNRIHGYYAHAVTADATRSGASGKKWVLTALGSQLDAAAAFELPLCTFAVAANQTVTVSVWVTKSHATNVVAKLVCLGGQIAGVPSDLIATKANDTNPEKLSLTVTPTESGTIKFKLQFYLAAGSSGSCDVDTVGAQ